MFGMSKAGTGAKKAAPEVARKPTLVSVTVKLEARQRDKLKALGGDAWLRDRIDAAAAPKSAVSPFAVDEEEA